MCDHGGPEVSSLPPLCQLPLLLCPGLVAPHHVALLVHDAPPPEARQQPARHVLHHPEVGREKHHDEDEAGDEGAGDDGGRHVDDEGQ